jgi:maltose alpha-D-glucosyltransferase / alpha-amylase
MQHGREKAPKLTDDPLWYKDAIIYQLHVKTFYDSNDDGLGDFRGLTEKLGYLQDLGVNALWLLPFYPSPLKDDGYDIADFRKIHPSYGTIQDFRKFLNEAHRRGMRVITELVINHTSDQHPWFQRARRAKPGSTWRDFYVWSQTNKRYQEARIIFKDFETSNWTWDPVAKAYYWHRFYSHQPDLNYDNPKVHEAIFKALDFWMDMGVDGLRLDAIPYLYERENTNCENLPETHLFLKKLRARMDAKYKNRMFLAEANQWPEDAVQYFGDGDECHMSFHFPLMPRLYMALHMEDRFPITDILEQTPTIPENCQWAIFLRNHDELTLEMVTDEERDYMYRFYAHDPRMRLNLGIRRRLAPLLGNHRRRIELMNALLMSLPGTPVIYYGDEIGMGDNIFLGDRNGVRTPMQWSADRNAGFSRVNPHQIYLPVSTDPEYHYEVFNVEAQQTNRHSLLWWMRRVIFLRKKIQAFSRGALTFLEPDNPKIIAFTRCYQEQCILVVANISRYVQFVELDLSDHEGAHPTEVFGNTVFPKIKGDEPYMLTLGPHSFYWFNLQRETPLTESIAAAADLDRLPVLKVKKSWVEIFQEDYQKLENLIPVYLKHQRWFGGKARRIKTARVRETVPMHSGEFLAYFVFVRLDYVDGSDETYMLPLTHATAPAMEECMEDCSWMALAKVRTEADSDQVSGYIMDALGLDIFRQELLAMIAKRSTHKGAGGIMAAVPTRFFKTLYDKKSQPLETKIVKAEQSNTSIVYANRFILKLFRRLQEGTNPDLEVGTLLTRKGFTQTPAVAGYLEYRGHGRAEPETMAILQAYVSNQGDAWEYTLETLHRYFEYVIENQGDTLPTLPRESLVDRAMSEMPEEINARLGIYLESARLIAVRTAQMHTVLASAIEDERFAPESFSKLYQRSIYQSMRSLTITVLKQFQTKYKSLPEHLHPLCRRILDQKGPIIDSFRILLEKKISGKRLRCHGDFHLGQVLYTGKDFVIIDFEGEPARPVQERRIKRSPLRDVAGMLRSFHYAAYSALREEERRGIFHGKDRQFAESWANYWYYWVSAVFLHHYLKEAAPAGFLPLTQPELQVLLDAFLMEKGIYELGYELNNRPDWLGIPVQGIEQLLALKQEQ